MQTTRFAILKLEWRVLLRSLRVAVLQATILVGIQWSAPSILDVLEGEWAPFLII